MPPTVQKTNGLAIASMVLGILVCTPCGIGSILALVFGYIAKKQIRESHGTMGGSGMATAGIVLGWIAIGLWVLYVIMLMVFRVNSGDPGY